MSTATQSQSQTQIQNPALFKSIKVGDLTFPNRIFVAPLTRARSDHDQRTQTPLHALYYAQRASSGLIVSEATQISQEGIGYAWTPGIHTDEQVESWKLVNDAIHNAGGHIFCQLWHVGAISHPVFQRDNGQPVSSSVWTPEGQAFVGSYHPDGPQVPHEEARALKMDEIPRILDDYRHAAKQAKAAGFDGIELHAANGYLIDQFLRDSVNQRDDQYGGSIENRVRLLTEVVDALCEVLPANRVGVRLTPIGGPGNSSDSDPMALYTAAAKAISGKGLAYLHVVRANGHTGSDSAELSEQVVKAMRKSFDGTFIANGGFTAEEANEWIENGDADAVAFGRLFISNPDLPERFASGAELNEPDQNTFYGGGAEGYVDYPSLKKTNDAM
ncbi:alkene reductase [Mariniblastus fucicola]|uniref:N-ethylmaleimide reductase n=1 Tax=Mariniblastus fucicola TaxID=980251 RepID=A0A5B9PFB7_9BACT|nr:alkene reductase [Mariniblastus fucicola]QEG24954.1 N-ethylmaleimide reductase [Mariniblastus fucicola]